MSRHLSVGYRVRSLLEFQNLEIHALAFIRQDEERIQGTFRPTSLIGVTFTRHWVTVEPGFDRQVGDSSATRATLYGNISRLGLDSWGGDNDSRDFDEFGHLVALETTDGGSGFVAAQGYMDILEFVFRITGSGHLNRETNIDLEGLFCEKLKAVWAEYKLNLESC